MNHGATEFVLSAEGMEFLREFHNQFDCGFRLDEPGGVGLLFDDNINDETYTVPEWETVEGIRNTVLVSMTSGKNHFPERYRAYRCEYTENVLY